MTREQLEKAYDKLKEIEDLVYKARLYAENRTANIFLEEAKDLIPELAQYLEEVCNEDLTTAS